MKTGWMGNKINCAIIRNLLAVPLAILLLMGCTETKTQLEEIMERGELRVATRNGPTSYYFERDSETGLEYELARRFAEHLNLDLKIITAKNTPEILELIKKDKADIAAAALVKFDHDEKYLNFGPNYQWITQNVVYRNRNQRPHSLYDISPHPLNIVDGALQPAVMSRLRESNPEVEWVVHSDKDIEDLLEMVENGEIMYTVIKSNDLAIMRHYYPEIRVAFHLADPRPLAWAFKKSAEPSLANQLDLFFKDIEQQGALSYLLEYYYGPVEHFDYVDSRAFVKRFTNRLPAYQPAFEEAATEYNLDWRLLAAVSYQESHWNRKARSPTGVRGLMMLTRNTAKSMGVENRLNPDESIFGGAAYLRELVDKLPERIKEPDRTWLALAAYNIGYGHLEDARVITEKQGGDPDKWYDVRERLPLLSKKKWYKQTRFGYARGYEAKHFVRNIRRYYNTLVQLTQPEPETGPDLKLVESLPIDSPVL